MRTAGSLYRNAGITEWAVLCGGRCGRFRFLKFIELAYNQEDDKGDDNKVDQRVDECPVVDRNCTRSLGVRQGRVSSAAQVDIQF